FSGRTARVVALAAVLTLTVAGCQLAKNQLDYDRSAEMSRQHYRDALAPVPHEKQAFAPVPDFQPVLSTPQELRLPSPLVTVSVNQTVSLRDLLFELAKQAEIDLELDPQIRGSIIFTAKERPFDEVVDRICEMAGLRYKFKNNVLRVELDRPYVHNYNVAFLNVTRSGNTKIDTEVKMGGSGGGEDTVGSTSGGSSSDVSSKYDGDLWADLSEGIEQILTSSDTYISLATLTDPVAVPINPAPPLPTIDENGQPLPPPAPGSAAVSAMPAAVAPNLNVSAVRAPEPLVPNPPATFSVSKQSGVLSVFASERQQKQVAEFLRNFRKRSLTQILIEAKVLQVELRDEFATGVQWDNLDITGLVRVQPNFAQPALSPAAIGNFVGRFEYDEFDTLLRAVNRFGTVRALSSPRVTVLNNQPAVVNVTQDNVYFNYDVTSDVDADTNVRTVQIESTQKSAPEGVLLNVLPSADPDTGEMLMIIRPTVSKITSFVTDPVIPFSLATLGIDPTNANVPDNQVPQLSIQEIDSILKMQSGQVLVLGGLMRDENIVDEEAVPVLGEIPFLGQAFKNHSDKIIKTELIVLLRAVIVPGSNVDDMDRKIYDAFALDRRPARL
ncbi:MAG: type II and III secretion system family protein, partial [Alphaproteobacteria bacterium]|nr:type II and III secretion system family protein [Alphaproteobacteria bacterium]